ncbi:MAG: D-glycerate dehydrogenase [Candidatus Latescibacterota bacterium]|nr:D-glycerate dehydrogenase [Candidatus Latescibacterota bacterium]
MAYLVMMSDTPADNILRMIGNQCDLTIWPKSGPSDAELESIEGFYTYGHMHVGGELMDRMPGLKVISNFGVGVDHIDLHAASQRRIPVGNTPDILNGATADMTITLLLAATRNLLIGDRYARSAEFTAYDPNILHGQEAHGSTIGIIGMGKIGQEVARRAGAFDMRILYHNRNRNLRAEDVLGAHYATLDDLLTTSDFVTLNCPLTEETRNLIGFRELKLMKRSAILVNVARGGVIDHNALVEALRTNEIAVAALDVTEPEPLPRDHPLLGLDNVIIAPHLGSATRQTREKMSQMSVDNLLAGLADKPLLSQITAD